MPISMRIPLSRSLGEALARGQALVDAQPKHLESVRKLFHDLVRIADDGVRQGRKGSADAREPGGDDAGVASLEKRG
jgi:hypothetical protein